MSERPATPNLAVELSPEAMRQKAIKQARRILAPHFDATLILVTWRNDDDKTQNDSAASGNANATEGLAKNFVENGCTFEPDPPEEGEEWNTKER